VEAIAEHSLGITGVVGVIGGSAKYQQHSTAQTASQVKIASRPVVSRSTSKY
jgi:hypothetical protein